jgi:hypothetical protein
MVLVLKTELNGDFRRIPLHNEYLTFDELHLMLCRVYSCDIDDEDKLKYMDEDGDWVTVQDSADLQFALQSVQQRNVSTLRLRIGGNQSGVPDEIVNELRSIRDMSITLLDRLAKSGNSSQTTPSPQKQEKAETPTRTPVVSEVTPVVSNHEDIKTFDPIGEKQEESIAYVEPISPAVPTPVVVESVPVVEPVPPPEPVLQPMIPPPVEQAPVVPTPIIPPAEPVQIAPVVPIVPVVQQQPPPEPEKRYFSLFEFYLIQILLVLQFNLLYQVVIFRHLSKNQQRRPFLTLLLVHRLIQMTDLIHRTGDQQQIHQNRLYQLQMHPHLQLYPLARHRNQQICTVNNSTTTQIHICNKLNKLLHLFNRHHLQLRPNKRNNQFNRINIISNISNRHTELILMHIINIINTINKLTISLHNSQRRLYNNSKCLLLHLGRLR